MRIVVWHGYLLSGTGSNIYTRALARAWSLAGHEVVVVCQEPHPERFDLAGARVVRPDIGGLLPTFVLDRYEGLEAKYIQDFTAEEWARYVRGECRCRAGGAAGRPRLREPRPAWRCVANGAGAPFAVKAHGSELEYSMRGRPELVERGRAALADARAVFVGSEHIREVLDEVVGHVDRVLRGAARRRRRRVPPAEPRGGARRSPRGGPARRRPTPGTLNERQPDEGNAGRLAAFFASDEPTVLYFGKLMRSKGVHVLFDALRDVDARALIVGFGDYRAELEALAPAGTLFTGALEHRHLVHVLPLCDVAVVPSIFPEAFGMVAAEAAAAGCPPVVARHSGLAEIAAGLEEAYGPERTALASFRNGDAGDLAARLNELLSLPTDERRRLGELARQTAVERWSWLSVAERLLAPFQ